MNSSKIKVKFRSAQSLVLIFTLSGLVTGSLKDSVSIQEKTLKTMIRSQSRNLETSCEDGQYYDDSKLACASCPSGCSTCDAADQCTGCSQPEMTIEDDGLCYCPLTKYFSKSDGVCYACQSKCNKCSNEYSCDTYLTCPNPFQELQADGSCLFNCPSGSHQDSTTCGTCDDPNCEICDPTGGQCGLCSGDFYLDLKTYTCKDSCPVDSLTIETSNTHDLMETPVRYCRPYTNVEHNYTYWVDSSSQSYLELGTEDHPFKNMDSPCKEVLNFMYSMDTWVTVYTKRGTTLDHYYGLMPMVHLNTKMYHMIAYGDPSAAKPYIYIRDNPYQWPDSSLLSIAEEFYDYQTRVDRGDMTQAESSIYFLKFNQIRASIFLQNIDFQAIMYGDAWSNPLIYSFDNYNGTQEIVGCYLDLDGALSEAYSPVGIKVIDSVVNITNYQYGMWLDFRWDCYTPHMEDAKGFLVIENSLFTGIYFKALYNFIFFGSMDDFIFRNNTLQEFVYLNMATRPFVDMHPNSVCDPDYRSQKIIHDNNKFVNLNSSNVIFSINYMNSYNGTKTFSMQNNTYIDSIINTQLLMLQISQTMDVVVANNYFRNVTIINGNNIFYFFSEQTDLPITNETVTECKLDDLYTIGAVNNLVIRDFDVKLNNNTGSITETSAFVSISQANGLVDIFNYIVVDSNFLYGKALQIQAAKEIDIRGAAYKNNSLSNQDFIQFNQIQKGMVYDLNFTDFSKTSDQARYALSFSSLALTAESSYLVQNINFTNSETSFLEVAQAQPLDSADTTEYLLEVTDCQVENNTLSSKDSLIEFGEINYKEFRAVLTHINIINNTLELGTIYSLQMNSKQLLIQFSQVRVNFGQFASLVPANSDPINPLRFFIMHTDFYMNYAKSDALIQLTTNSIMEVKHSNFLENYSIGRGSIVFADYQEVYALFENCTIQKNYAYQGGVFYIQYSSVLEVRDSQILDNFGVIGGVAYVNNDGRIMINNGSVVLKNSALNTCFLFLINTQYVSIIDNIEISMNDQNHSILVKDTFLTLNETYKHINLLFIDGMKGIYSKVDRTIKEKTDSAVYSIKASINFTDTIIHQNDVFLSASTSSKVNFVNTSITNVTATGQVIQLVSSTINLLDVLIEDIQYDQQMVTSSFYKISVVNKSFFYSKNFLLQDILGPLFYVSGATFDMKENTIVTNCTNDDNLSPLMSFDSSNIYLNDSTFFDLKSDLYSPIINLQNNWMELGNCSFYDFDKSLFQIVSGTYYFYDLTVHTSNMVWQMGDIIFQVNAVIFDIAAAMVTIEKSKINGIHSEYSSPVIYMYNDPASTNSILLELVDSEFKDNSAVTIGGAIEVINTNASIRGCLFENNEAGSQGGALYLSCEDTAKLICQYNVTSSTFINNRAPENGGAIKYDFYAPNISDPDNVFIDNYAKYGPDSASYPAQLILLDSELELMSDEVAASLGLQDVLLYKLTRDLVSGSIMSQNLSLQIWDENGNIFVTDSSSQVTLTPIQTNDEQKVQVMQTKTVQADEGILKFDDAIVIGSPGTDVLIQLTTDAINKNKIEKAFPELGMVKDIYIKGFLRYCIRGEYESTDNKCLVCQDGFYNLLFNQSECIECPEHAQCVNGENITVDTGYWRESLDSAAIYQCYNIEACPSNDDVTCTVGYGGNLCQSCVLVDDKWYYQSGSSQCFECIDHKKNSWRLTGVTIVVICYVVFLVLLNVQKAGQKSYSTVYMRILTNYFQILTLTQSFDLSWDDNLRKFLEAISFIAKSSDILLSIDCFLRHQTGQEYQPIFVKMILSCVILVGAIILAIIVWALAGLVKKTLTVKRNMIISTIVLIFLFLPSISSITMSIYNCIDIFGNGDSYLAVDMSLQCWAGEQKKYAYRYGLPIIFIWIIGFPLIAFGILFKNRKSLNDYEFKASFGFIYLGLKDHAFYWEIMLHFRKILIISINVFFTTFVSLYRALIGFMLMIIYIEFLQKIQPYQTDEMNDLELKANIAAFATFYGGLFFISEGIPISVSIIIFIIIMVINFVFWFYWCALMFNGPYIKLRNYLMQKFCMRLYQNMLLKEAQKKALEEVAEKKEQNKDLEPKDQESSRRAIDDSKNNLLLEQDSQRMSVTQRMVQDSKKKKAREDEGHKKKRKRNEDNYEEDEGRKKNKGRKTDDYDQDKEEKHKGPTKGEKGSSESGKDPSTDNKSKKKASDDQDSDKAAKGKILILSSSDQHSELSNSIDHQLENPNKYNVKEKLKKVSNQQVDEGLADHRKNKFEDEGEQKKKSTYKSKERDPSGKREKEDHKKEKSKERPAKYEDKEENEGKVEKEKSSKKSKSKTRPVKKKRYAKDDNHEEEEEEVGPRRHKHKDHDERKKSKKRSKGRDQEDSQ